MYCAPYRPKVNNHPLDMADTFVIAFTATLAAVGAAAIPSAGLVTMVMVLTAVGMEAYIKDIAFVLAIDWFLDRFRTVVNVEGDCFGCGNPPSVDMCAALRESRSSNRSP